jgi:FtsZ-binding cell division protein ZapB
MAVTREQQETDALASLEERIARTVELVSMLRQENQKLVQRLEAADAARDEARSEARLALEETEKLSREVDELREERKQVRSRIEKLLGQMDVLSNT